MGINGNWVKLDDSLGKCVDIKRWFDFIFYLGWCDVKFYDVKNRF